MARVRLEGVWVNLEILARLFPTDPRVVKEGEDYFLESAAVNDAIISGAQPPNAPEDIARTLLLRMNGVARSQVSRFEVVQMTNDWQGYKPGAYIRLGTVRLYAGVPPEFTANTAFAAKVLAAAERNVDIARALRFLNGTGGQPDWFDLYKVYEIVKAEVSSKRVEQWTSGRISVFTEVANRHEATGDRARHAKLPGAWSGKSMSYGEAVDLIATIMARWIDERA